MTRMTTGQEAQRAEIEDAMARLVRAQRLLDVQVRLRLRQGVQRGLGELLGPALDHVDDVERQVSQAHETLSRIWKAGNAADWLARRPQK